MSLIDCLVYISLLGVFLYLMSLAVFEADMGSKLLRRNADQIGRAVRAGEAWREDLRRARGAVEAVRGREGGVAGQEGEGDGGGGEGEGVRSPGGAGMVMWVFREAGVWRSRDGQAWELLVPGVKGSEMRAEPGGLPGVWRWELELQTTRTNARVRPLFSFSAVSGTEVGR